MFIYILLCGHISVSQAEDGQNICQSPINFIEIQSLDLEQIPPSLLTIKGKLILPVNSDDDEGCAQANKDLTAVLILHGTEGVGFQERFYAEALNAAGIAPPWKLICGKHGEFLHLLIAHRCLYLIIPMPLVPSNFFPNIQVLIVSISGSWGFLEVQLSHWHLLQNDILQNLGEDDPHFSAHVAHYPICYAYNSGIPGSEFIDLTGAPILIQIGMEDDYDQLENENGHGATKCFALKDSLPIEEQEAVQVIGYENAFHEWDRLLVPTVVKYPFSHLGLGEDVSLIPNPTVANKSRKQVLKFFRQHL